MAAQSEVEREPKRVKREGLNGLPLPSRCRYECESCEFELLAVEKRARRARLRLPHAEVQTPSYMPVATNGALKMVPSERLQRIGYKLILNNTYHLGSRLGKEIIAKAGGMRKVMCWPHNILTDSGGFQMVSLTRFSEVTEDGVRFEHPETKEVLNLTPEESTRIQAAIGADVMMQLDDVISVVAPDRARFALAAERTTRWLDRCLSAKAEIATARRQNLWGITQGGLDRELRQQCLDDLNARDCPGYAIGGLSGGEPKSDFWKMVSMSTADGTGLSAHKSRYLMGVGYPADLVVCVALGVDLFDCVFPTRTARFGNALTSSGMVKLKSACYAEDMRPVCAKCSCYCCKQYTRAFINQTVSFSPSVQAALSEHNLTFMFELGRRMREALERGAYTQFVKEFLAEYFPGLPPFWIRDALVEGAQMREILEWYDWDSVTPEMEQEMRKKEVCGYIPHTEFVPRKQK